MTSEVAAVEAIAPEAYFSPLGGMPIWLLIAYVATLLSFLVDPGFYQPDGQRTRHQHELDRIGDRHSQKATHQRIGQADCPEYQRSDPGVNADGHLADASQREQADGGDRIDKRGHGAKYPRLEAILSLEDLGKRDKLLAA